MSRTPLILTDGTPGFKYWLKDDELEYLTRLFIAHSTGDKRRFEYHFTKYFMEMHQKVLSQVRATIRGKDTVSRKYLRDLIVKCEKDYSKSHGYEFLGIECDRRIRQFVTQICDHWLLRKTNVKVTD